MPSRVVLRLNLERPVEGREIKPDILHGLFFKLLPPELAEDLHGSYGDIKPYSLACRELFGDGQTKVLHLEINLLEDKLLPKVLSGAVLKEGKKLFLGKVGVSDFSILPVGERGIVTYQSLVGETGEHRKWFVRFKKPTTFRRNDIDLPLPLPELIFKGLVKRWNAFSPIPVGVDLRPFYNLVKVSKCAVRTQKVELSSGGKLTTFTGYTLLDLSPVRNEKALKWFGILLNFANWSGIGRKTTMGLGKVAVSPAGERGD